MHLHAAEIKTSRGSFGRAREDSEARIGHVPNSGTALVLGSIFDVGLVDAIVALQEHCFRRGEFRIGGDEPLEAMRSVSEIAAATEEADFDQEVHQVLAPSTSLLAELGGGGSQFDPDRLLRLVSPGGRGFRPELGHVLPKEPESPGGQYLRPRSGRDPVLGGAAEHVENGVASTALELVTSTGWPRRIRDRAITALRSGIDMPSAQKQGLENQRRQIAGLAGQLRHSSSTQLRCRHLPGQPPAPRDRPRRISAIPRRRARAGGGSQGHGAHGEQSPERAIGARQIRTRGPAGVRSPGPAEAAARR